MPEHIKQKPATVTDWLHDRRRRLRRKASSGATTTTTKQSRLNEMGERVMSESSSATASDPCTAPTASLPKEVDTNKKQIIVTRPSNRPATDEILTQYHTSNENNGYNDTVVVPHNDEEHPRVCVPADLNSRLHPENSKRSRLDIPEKDISKMVEAQYLNANSEQLPRAKKARLQQEEREVEGSIFTKKQVERPRTDDNDSSLVVGQIQMQAQHLQSEVMQTRLDVSAQKEETRHVLEALHEIQQEWRTQQDETVKWQAKCAILQAENAKLERKYSAIKTEYWRWFAEIQNKFVPRMRARASANANKDQQPQPHYSDFPKMPTMKMSHSVRGGTNIKADVNVNANGGSTHIAAASQSMIDTTSIAREVQVPSNNRSDHVHVHAAAVSIANNQKRDVTIAAANTSILPNSYNNVDGAATTSRSSITTSNSSIRNQKESHHVPTLTSISTGVLQQDNATPICKTATLLLRPSTHTVTPSPWTSRVLPRLELSQSAADSTSNEAAAKMSNSSSSRSNSSFTTPRTTLLTRLEHKGQHCRLPQSLPPHTSATSDGKSKDMEETLPSNRRLEQQNKENIYPDGRCRPFVEKRQQFGPGRSPLADPKRNNAGNVHIHINPTNAYRCLPEETKPKQHAKSTQSPALVQTKRTFGQEVEHCSQECSYNESVHENNRHCLSGMQQYSRPVHPIVLVAKTNDITHDDASAKVSTSQKQMKENAQSTNRRIAEKQQRQSGLVQSPFVAPKRPGEIILVEHNEASLRHRHRLPVEIQQQQKPKESPTITTRGIVEAASPLLYDTSTTGRLSYSENEASPTLDLSQALLSQMTASVMWESSAQTANINSNTKATNLLEPKMRHPDGRKPPAASIVADMVRPKRIVEELQQIDIKKNASKILDPVAVVPVHAPKYQSTRKTQSNGELEPGRQEASTRIEKTVKEIIKVDHLSKCRTKKVKHSSPMESINNFADNASYVASQISPQQSPLKKKLIAQNTTPVACAVVPDAVHSSGSSKLSPTTKPLPILKQQNIKKGLHSVENPYAKQPKRRATPLSFPNSDDDDENDVPTYKYAEVVRNKAQRQALPAQVCPECDAFVDAVCNAPGGHVFDRKHLHNCSRHRARFTPPHTPDGFWELSFADEIKARQGKAHDEEETEI